MIFCPSNAHNSNAQSFPEIKYYFTALLSLCIVRESNPFQQLGRLLCYHYTNDAEKGYDRRDEFQNIQTWIFPYTFSKCHSKKKPKLFFEKLIVFSLTRLLCFSLIESCVSDLLLLEVIGKSKNDKKLLFYECFVPLTHTIVKLNLFLKTNTVLPPF